MDEVEEGMNNTLGWDFCSMESPRPFVNATMDDDDDQCYPKMTKEETASFFDYEKNVGFWGNICIGLIGIVGNFVSVVVLGQKDMRTNCFNQLLIGELHPFLTSFVIVIIHFFVENNVTKADS